MSNGIVQNEPEDVDDEGLVSRFMADPSVMPATVAQQVFSIVPGIAGGIAGFLLATRLANTKRVKTSGVLIASSLVAVLTFATIFLIVEADEITEG